MMMKMIMITTQFQMKSCTATFAQEIFPAGGDFYKQSNNILLTWTSPGITSSTTYNLSTQMKEGIDSANMMKHDINVILDMNTTHVFLLIFNSLPNKLLSFCNPCFKVVYVPTWICLLKINHCFAPTMEPTSNPLSQINPSHKSSPKQSDWNPC